MTALATPVKQTAKDRVIAALTEQPGQTAKELGESPVTMNRLMKAGVVEQVVTRGTGDRGRPSNVYVLYGQEFDTTADEAAATQAALVRVTAHRAYERMSRAMVDAHNTYGYGSPEHVEAKLNRKDAFPIPPEQPSDNDFAVIGAAGAVTSLDDLNAKDDADTADLDSYVV